MEDDFKGVSICSDDYEFGDTSVEGFGGLVGSLLDLLECGTLRDQVIELRGKLFSCEWLCSF